MVSLVQASTATPENNFSTAELVASIMHKLSPGLIDTICSLGVQSRYSVMDNYPEFLAGAALLCHEYYGFRDIARMRKSDQLDDADLEQHRTETTLVVQSMLFGDGAVALLLGAEREGKPAFGPISLIA